MARLVVDLRKAAQFFLHGRQVSVPAYMRGGHAVRAHVRGHEFLDADLDRYTDAIGRPEDWLTAEELRNLGASAGLGDGNSSEFSENPGELLTRLYDGNDPRAPLLDDLIEQSWRSRLHS
jgi:hypothetical protein